MTGAQAHQAWECDFCRSTPGAWWFEARPFVRRVPVNGRIHSLPTARTAWAACGPCADLIRNGNWDGLADRRIEVEPNPDLLDLVECRRWAADLHLHIRDALTGTVVPMLLAGGVE